MVMPLEMLRVLDLCMILWQWRRGSSRTLILRVPGPAGYRDRGR